MHGHKACLYHLAAVPYVMRAAQLHNPWKREEVHSVIRKGTRSLHTMLSVSQLTVC